MTTPNSILKLAHKLLDVRAGEQVADVCCGSGTYIVSAALEEPNASYHGYEINVANSGGDDESRTSGCGCRDYPL